MKTKFKVALGILLVLAVAALTTYYISTTNVEVLNPKGIIGAKERDLLITASLLMLIVVVPVFILLWYISWVYREGNEARHDPDWEHNYIAEYCWWGVPLIIVIVLAIITWKTTHELNPFTPLKSDKKPYTVQVVALRWKWLFIYPEQGVAAVNYLQVPVDRPINFEITADAPMNSFWIPQLAGQIYAMPGMRAQLHVEANEPGTYRGLSAHISGRGFAGMYFTVEAGSEQEVTDFVSKAKQSGRALNRATYEMLVEPSEYDPVQLFNLTDPNLFEQIIDSYRMPKKEAS